MNYSHEEELIEYIIQKAKHYIFPSEENGFKSKLLQSNVLLSFVVLLLVLKIIASVISVNFPQNIFFADITKSALESLVNQTRQAMGLETLTENAKLNQAAQLKADNMVQNQYFEHTSPTGITSWHWFNQVGYEYKYAGENLAIGFFESEEVFDAWLNSPSHKANIINPNYTDIGTAVLSGFGQNNSVVVVQEFGSQLQIKPVVAKNNAPAAPTKTAPVLIASETLKIKTQTNGEVLSRVVAVGVDNYKVIFQKVIYGVSFVVIGILLMLIFFNFKITFKKQLVFRAILIVVLLSVATLLNERIIISLIPHQIII